METQLDEATARRIVEQCYDGVLSYCRRHAPDHADAQDLAQETFLRFVQCGLYEDRGKPMAYLVAIARSVCADAARRAPRWVPFEGSNTRQDGAEEEGSFAPTTPEPAASLDGTPVPAGAAAEWAAEAHAIDGELACALAALSPEEAEVLELRYDQGFSIREVAEALGVSRFAAARALRRALKRLEDELS